MFVLGCSDSTGLDAGDLVGVWNSTEWTLTEPADPTQTVDLSSMGARLSISFDSDDTFVRSVDFPREPHQVDSGGYAITGEVLALTDGEDGTSTFFKISLDSDVMTLVGGGIDPDDVTGGSETNRQDVITLRRE